MSKPIREAYIQYRTNPDTDKNSLSHFCTRYGFSLSEARSVLTGDKELENDVLLARRAKYATRMQKIDDALFESAEKGDTRAADLLYRRFDGWNPKMVEETNNFYSFTDIIKSAATKKATIIKRTLPDDGAA